VNRYEGASRLEVRMRGRIRRVAACCLLLAVFPCSAEENPPPAELGTVAGSVIGKTTGEPIIDVGVEVVGQGKTVRTDLDGRYTIKLPPGDYELRLFAPSYQPLRVKGVIVKVNKVTTQNATLAEAQQNVEVVEVVAQANKAAEATQLLQRKNSAVVSETVSAEAIKKSPASDAAQVVQRVPAVTIRENKFIFVRGLGERYSSALLNGSRLPSTDPERRVVPLDLFPAPFIESLSVVKSYTPDLPGDFSGGLADIHLRDYPEQFEFNTGISTGGNTQTTFRRFNSSQGGNLDYLGFGSNFRKLPERTPDTAHVKAAGPVELSQIGRLFRDDWGITTESAPPNSGFNFSLGDTFGKLGMELGGIYTTEYKNIPARIERQFLKNQVGSTGDCLHDDSCRDDFRFAESTFQTRLGGIFTAAYKLADNQKLMFRSLIDRNTFDNVITGQGIDFQDKSQIRAPTRLRYTEEELDFGQISGEHRWPLLWVDWRTAYSRTTQNEPDTRSYTYVDGVLNTSEPLSGDRLFNDLKETLTDSAVDFTIPFNTALPFTDVWSGLPAKFKFGPAYAYRKRDFQMRRFSFGVTNAAAAGATDPPDSVFDSRNIFPGIVDFSEQTQPKDSFTVSQEIIGGYGMFDLPLVRDRLRLVAGVRMEYSFIKLKAFGDLGTDTLERVTQNNLDPLPGANLVYSPRDDMNVRFGYSRSVSRPEFRELTPTQFPAPRGLRPLQGNPNLVESQIENYDARWEWFFSPLELVSLSFFYKDLAQPIEQVVIPESSNNVDSFKNGTTGSIQGFEFEGRKNFGFVHDRFKNLSLVANVAYIDSTVTLEKTKLEVQTTSVRPLQGQSPYVANAVVDYTHPDWGTVRLLYNTAGRRITSAGSFGLADIYEEPRNELDAVVIVPLQRFGFPLTAKLAAENLLDDRVLFTQGGRVQRQYETGIKVTFGLSYSY
jgi:hypothetical protein